MNQSITEKTLFTRINRLLKSQGKRLRKCRIDSRVHQNLGDYYEVDLEHNLVTATHVDLERWGKELFLIKPSAAVIA
ncbi:hypothetical protein [Chromobacterium amazonense]|uniref:hypothetical protein n=1 Tax=Chromobacterium amazonense TaxID=1382803 RepID=UPI0031F6F6EE